MENLTNFGLISGLVLGLVQVVKIAGLNSRWLPLVGLIVGGLLSYAIIDVDLVTGLVAALTAMGLFSGTKATAGK